MENGRGGLLCGAFPAFSKKQVHSIDILMVLAKVVRLEIVGFGHLWSEKHSNSSCEMLLLGFMLMVDYSQGLGAKWWI